MVFLLGNLVHFHRFQAVNLCFVQAGFAVYIIVSIMRRKICISTYIHSVEFLRTLWKGREERLSELKVREVNGMSIKFCEKRRPQQRREPFDFLSKGS
jgi:hypothetical protein